MACGFILSEHSSYVKKLAANGYTSVPEWRLTPPIVGASEKAKHNLPLIQVWLDRLYQHRPLDCTHTC